ncbi:unnamed protein product [Lactuca saligna]|uniref:Plant heme peroxidase family profile domain-containing protein n=1 Tax=Lactuca saligna TaxID=75948 RepID=A0AA36EIC1_LACSI|nr:unnamed protein product [Lactuca saligna]
MNYDLTNLPDYWYRKEIEKARRDLRYFIFSKECAPIMLRLAFHDAGTYCKRTGTGGPNGSIRKPEEFEQSCNRGLKTAIDFCEEIKLKHPMISYADIYQCNVFIGSITDSGSLNLLPTKSDKLHFRGCTNDLDTCRHCCCGDQWWPYH